MKKVYNMTDHTFINLKFLFNRLNFLLIFVWMFILVGCAQTSTPQQTTENTVAKGVIDDLRLSDTSELSIEECAEKINAFAQSVPFKENATIPIDTLILIDFDAVYMSWQDVNVEVICTLANYGIYHTHEIITAPNDGEMWFIQLDE